MAKEEKKTHSLPLRLPLLLFDCDERRRWRRVMMGIKWMRWNLSINLLRTTTEFNLFTAFNAWSRQVMKEQSSQFNYFFRISVDSAHNQQFIDRISSNKCIITTCPNFSSTSILINQIDIVCMSNKIKIRKKRGRTTISTTIHTHFKVKQERKLEREESRKNGKLRGNCKLKVRWLFGCSFNLVSRDIYSKTFLFLYLLLKSSAHFSRIRISSLHSHWCIES